MAKVVISEERLNRIIKESIIEAINEAMEDEGLGHTLGNAYQWARNKWNNFKGDFNAGRNYQRYQNMNYDPYSKYNNGDEFRNLNGQEYAAQRYNNTVTRNANARQWTRDKAGQTTQGRQQNTQGQSVPQQQNQIEPTGNPDVAQTAPQAQPAAAKRGFQPKQARPVADIQAQVTNGRLMSKADGQLVAAALGEYKRNHPEINEGIIKEAVANAIKNYITTIK
jgi:hypothetical protein